MKQDFRSLAPVKAVAVLLFIACGVAACFGWLYCGKNWDSFADGSYADSSAWYDALNSSYSQLADVLNMEWEMQNGNSLSYLERQRYDAMRAQLEPAQTNFRYTVRDNATGALLFSSSGANSLEGVWPRVYTNLRHYSYQDDEGGRVAYDGEREEYIWYNAEGGEIAFSQSLDEVPDEVLVRREKQAQWAVEYGVDGALAVQDAFYAAKTGYVRGEVNYLYATLALSVLALALGVFLMCCAGRRRGAEGFVLNWVDGIPYDLYMAGVVAGGTACMAGVADIDYGIVHYAGQPYEQVLLILTLALAAALMLLLASALMSTAARIKTRTLLKNTVVWRILKWLGRLLRGLAGWWGATFGSWSVTGRVILLYLLYLLVGHLVPFTVVLWPVFHGLVLLGLCLWLRGWKTIRAGTAAIVAGHPEATIDTSAMKAPIYKDLREHAEQLNDLGSAIDSAVKERLKSERMKAELITNVSHDLKTPLTSIINYVDLLKKEDIQGEKAREYIEVLDRKSQRLKKLTEDLVEASKASTGALPVNAERIGVTQLVSQALGEYSEKCAAAQLTLVPALPGEEVYLRADGRHLWRILDNLLGNCVKYALSGTRIYLDVADWDGWVVLSVKNVSAQQLNIPADALMERFVRGDESRTTEGSGLGLSIAKSLTELNGGVFSLSVDGDLFKATVRFPRVD